MDKVAVILASAGIGNRFDVKILKPLFKWRDYPLFIHPLLTLINWKKEYFSKFIVITIPEGTDKKFKDAIVDAKINIENINIKIIAGGKTRQESIKLALDNITDDYEVVIIQDSARPIIIPEILSNMFSMISKFDGVVPVFHLDDSIAEISKYENKVNRYFKRENIVRVQTPKIFKLSSLKLAHKKASDKKRLFTDDGSMLLHYGFSLGFVCGDIKMMKITNKNDIKILEAIS